MIVGSFVFISADPCLVGFFVHQESTSRPQLNKATVLGITTQTQFCRKVGKKEADRFEGRFWTQGEFGAPLVSGSVASMECQIENVTRVGDHDFVLTRVLGLNRGNTRDPLVFQNHEFAGLRPC